MCAIFGVYNQAEAATQAYLGLYAQQHRGQESAGIVSCENGRFHAEKGMGHVADIFTKRKLAKLLGTAAVAHTRYATAGETALKNAQPLTVDCNKGVLALAHNGNLTNALTIRAGLEENGSIFQTTSDTEVILHLIAHSSHKDLTQALCEALLKVEGAYSLILLSRDRLYAIRDPRGFRPLAHGVMPDGSHVFASETCAFDLIGAAYKDDVAPGTMMIAEEGGVTTRRFAEAQPPAACIFEHVYFSRPDSVVFGQPVYRSREALGRRLAREAPADADLVVPVPDSGTAAAIGYSAESGLPFKWGLIRSHYAGRTFIEPEQSIRDFGVKLKLNPVREILEGRRVVLVDDSIVRGTTSKKIVRMVREAGAAEVHLRISCPPTISPCYYGVDTPNLSELIAANRSVESIREFIGADSLKYLSLEGLHAAVQDSATSRFCSACYTGNYPTELVLESQIGRGRG
jgi:amidophosphoribosyltransferase